MKKIVCIIQARLGSTRLPNKVLLKIPQDSDITCLDRVIERVKNCTLVDDIVLTTPDLILSVNVNIKGKVYYGKRDVLKEFYEAAIFFNADIIVRICADCPLIDPEIIDQCIDEFLDSDVDLVYNSKNSYNDGTDVEVFSFDALQKTYKESKEREHICIWMKENLKIKFIAGQPKYKVVSLDTWSDYEEICRIWEKQNSVINAKL